MTDVASTAAAARTKAKIAEHYLIDAEGEKVENEEDATGIGYARVGHAAPMEYQIPDGKARLLFALFGAKTLATNISSGVRNGPKGAGSTADEMDAIAARFALIESGTFVDRSGGGFAKLDLDALAASLVEVAEQAGKSADYAAIRQRMEEDDKWARSIMKVPGVTESYNKRVGRSQVTLDDALAALD